MKDVTKLRENECIYCPTRKSAKKILKLAGKIHLIHLWSDFKSFYFPKMEDFDLRNDAEYFEHKQFLPKKKASIKKRLKALESKMDRHEDLFQIIFEKSNPNANPETLTKEKIRELTEPKNGKGVDGIKNNSNPPTKN